MQCKDALNADAVRDFPHREASIVAAATSCNHHTFEHLYALLVPFDDALVDLYGIARTESRNFLLLPATLNHFHYVHDDYSLVPFFKNA
jgi:hypothetical protein